MFQGVVRKKKASEPQIPVMRFRLTSPPPTPLCAITQNIRLWNVRVALAVELEEDFMPFDLSRLPAIHTVCESADLTFCG